MLLTSGGTLCCEQLTQHSTAWKVWKSQINLMQSGCTSPTAPGGRYSRNSHCLHYTMHSHNGFVPSFWALLSVMKNWGDHPGFHSFSFCKPSCINSSVSYWGIIVATTRPIPSAVFTTRKKQGNPYCSVLYVASMHVMVFPYCCSYLLCCFVWRTKRKDWSASGMISPSDSLSCRFFTAWCISFRMSGFLEWITCKVYSIA